MTDSNDNEIDPLTGLPMPDVNYPTRYVDATGAGEESVLYSSATMPSFGAQPIGAQQSYLCPRCGYVLDLDGRCPNCTPMAKPQRSVAKMGGGLACVAVGGAFIVRSFTSYLTWTGRVGVDVNWLGLFIGVAIAIAGLWLIRSSDK